MAIAVGYALSAEEHGPRELAGYAHRAEQTGFSLAAVSDHFHPWTGLQGESPFVWGVLGAISEVTEEMVIGTRVTCPTFRVHPAVVAQAAATAAVQLEGRFFLGLGSGEYLNEHVLGDHWPPAPERLDRLEEAIEVIRSLWSGREVTHRGRWYQVQHARLFTRPDEPPPIVVAASGPRSLRVAAGSDGMIGVKPDPELLAGHREAGGRGLVLGELKVCWASDEADARRVAREWWPMGALGGSLGTDLSRPSHFEAATATLSEEAVAETVVCGPDAGRHIDAIRSYEACGYDAVWIHQVGPDQDGFFDFYEKEVLPELERPDRSWWGAKARAS